MAHSVSIAFIGVPLLDEFVNLNEVCKSCAELSRVGVRLPLLGEILHVFLGVGIFSCDRAKNCNKDCEAFHLLFDINNYRTKFNNY